MLFEVLLHRFGVCDYIYMMLNISICMNKELMLFFIVSTLTRTVKFPGDWGPLGIHVVPYCSSLSGR